MKIIRWVIPLALLLAVIAAFDYAVPARQVVRVVGTEVVRQDTGTGITRDIRYINSERPNGRERVFRNQDNGWYLKFESGNLQAKAQSRAKDQGGWAVVRYYGWRIPIMSMYPNALGMRSVDGPDQTLVPWGRIILAIILAGLALFAWRRWVRFRTNSIDPALEGIEEAIERADTRKDQLWQRLRKFFSSTAK
jgi:hypothetical protein